jgi:hypothetical protein
MRCALRIHIEQLLENEIPNGAPKKKTRIASNGLIQFINTYLRPDSLQWYRIEPEMQHTINWKLTNGKIIVTSFGPEGDAVSNMILHIFEFIVYSISRPYDMPVTTMARDMATNVHSIQFKDFAFLEGFDYESEEDSDYYESDEETDVETDEETDEDSDSDLWETEDWNEQTLKDDLVSELNTLRHPGPEHEKIINDLFD